MSQNAPRKRVAPPGGWAPPARASFDGRDYALDQLAGEVADRYLPDHPDDVETYGQDMARRWCVHDMQHVFNWALGEYVDLPGQVDWLAGVLGARGYPLANLADCLDVAAAVAEERIGAAPAADLRAAAERVRGR